MTVPSRLEKHNGIDASKLTPLQRILLITDGTLTEILEAYYLEPIKLVKLSQEIVPSGPAHAALDPLKQENFMERKIILRGAKSGTNYVYAESVIAFERLGTPLRDGLLNSNTPLGRLWLEHRLETFKEFIDARCMPANDLAVHFDCTRDTPLLTRTYRVATGGKPVMIIAEYFPAS